MAMSVTSTSSRCAVTCRSPNLQATTDNRFRGPERARLATRSHQLVFRFSSHIIMIVDGSRARSPPETSSLAATY
ncbi:hypothetical protein QFZ74_000874 [Streptomyces sp. V3I7]|nr:hypothetical protein [Streptomyces sp. V3I7]